MSPFAPPSDQRSCSPGADQDARVARVDRETGLDLRVGGERRRRRRAARARRKGLEPETTGSEPMLAAKAAASAAPEATNPSRRCNRGLDDPRTGRPNPSREGLSRALVRVIVRQDVGGRWERRETGVRRGGWAAPR